MQLSLYRRHNRCVDGPLAVGSPAPDAALVPVSPSAVAAAREVATEESGAGSLHGLLARGDGGGSGREGDGGPCGAVAAGRPLVVVAGSYT